MFEGLLALQQFVAYSTLGLKTSPTIVIIASKCVIG
jgi:hypothetical protein